MGFSIFCLAEFWSIVTHPICPNRPSEPGEANDFIDRFVTDGGAQIWLPESGFASRSARLACSMKVTGARVFDLQIALIASESGARTIWTHDSRFLLIKGLSVMDPLKNRLFPFIRFRFYGPDRTTVPTPAVLLRQRSK